VGDYIRKNTLHAIVGDIRFAENGEGAPPRVLQIQYQNIKGNDLEQFKKPGTQVIVHPPAFKSGALQYPYADIKR